MFSVCLMLLFFFFFFGGGLWLNAFITASKAYDTLTPTNLHTIMHVLYIYNTSTCVPGLVHPFGTRDPVSIGSGYNGHLFVWIVQTHQD